MGMTTVELVPRPAPHGAEVGDPSGSRHVSSPPSKMVMASFQRAGHGGQQWAVR